MAYEIFWSRGGHVGPFADLGAAVSHAERVLRRPFDGAEVRQRDAAGIGGYGAVVARVYYSRRHLSPDACEQCRAGFSGCDHPECETIEV